jgi:hypothetical protein
MEEHKKILAVAVSITAVLVILVLLHYRAISGRPGTLVIPAGNTYLGPNTPNFQTQPKADQPLAETPWKTFHGRIYPYTFSAPEDLKLKTFPNDVYDIYAIDCCGVDPGANVLVGVDHLKNNINQSLLAYVQNWWHQFSGLKSVTSIDPFTNSKGLKGYKAKFVNSAGETPNLDVFFEVPGHPEYVIHMASGTLDTDTFAKIIDTVSWEK